MLCVKKTTFPYEEDLYDLNTVPSAAAETGLLPPCAMSIPSCILPHLPPNPEVTGPDAGHCNIALLDGAGAGVGAGAGADLELLELLDL